MKNYDKKGKRELESQSYNTLLLQALQRGGEEQAGVQPGAECGEGGGEDGDASDHRLVSGDKSVSVSMRIFYDSPHSTTGYVCTEMTRLAATVMEVRLGNLSLTQVIFG